MQDNDFKYRIEFTKDEYENLKQYINEFASKLSKMSDEEIQKHLTFDNERATPKDNSEKGRKTIMKFKLNSELLLFQRMKHLQGICNFVLSLYKIRQKESRSDFTEKEKVAIKAFANPDNAFSLMSEMYLRNQLPWLWT